MKVTGKAARFVWAAGRPAVDFVNTTVVQRGRTVDLLGSAADLLDWVEGAGLVRTAPHGFSRYELKHLLGAACTLRRRMRDMLTALAHREPLPRAAVLHLNRLLAKPARGAQLVRHPGGWQLGEFWRIEEPLDLLRPIAFDAAELIASPAATSVRHCASPNCILFFVDTTKSGTRRWCSMALCGNRAKVAAFHRRHRSASRRGSSIHSSARRNPSRLPL